MDDGEIGVAGCDHGEHAGPPVGVRRPQAGMARYNLPDSRQLELVNNGSGFDTHGKIMALMASVR
jgi:hypothetical protein